MCGLSVLLIKEKGRIFLTAALLVTIFFSFSALPAFSQGNAPGKIASSANVYLAMKTITDAAKSYEVKHGKGSIPNLNRETLEKLVAEGSLTLIPEIDPKICTDKGPEGCEWDYNSRHPGGIDDSHPARLYFETKPVTEGFCKSFNKEVGLGSIVVPNCSTSKKCPRVKDPGEFPEDVPKAFCYKQEDEYRVYFDAGPGHGEL